MTKLITALFVVCLIASGSGSGQTEAKQAKRKWLEPDDLTETKRLQRRPGSFQVIACVSQFLEGLYEVKPRFGNCAFPFCYMGDIGKSTEELDRLIAEEMRKDEDARNARRKYIFELKSMTVYDIEEGSEVDKLKLRFKAKGLRLKEKPLFDSHDLHKGRSDRSLVVLLFCEAQSLRSDKIERIDEPLVFHVIYKDGKWLVVLYSE